MRTATEKPPTVNVARHLRRQACRQPYRRAVVCPAGRDPVGRVAYTHLTFRQLDQESDRLAHGLQGAGIQRGTRTILMVRPSLEFFALIFAFFKIGAVPVVVDPGMGLRRMLGCLKESRAEALVGIPPAHLLRKVARHYFRSVKVWVTVGRRYAWRGPTLAELRRASPRPYPIAETAGEETAAILFTTGSTGPAKGAVYTHAVFEAQVRTLAEHFKFSADEIDLTTFPLFSLFYAALGVTTVIPEMDPTKPARVNPLRIIEAVQNQGITNMFASPALLNRVGRFGKPRRVKLPCLRRVISAGAPVSPDVIETFAALLPRDADIQTGYGATEAMPVAMMRSREIFAETRTHTEKGYGICVGRPLPGLEVAIIKISDHPVLEWAKALRLPQGEIGEIVVRGELVTRRYFDRPRNDALAKIADGKGFWHRMGDVGWMDHQNRLWFCGRKDHRVVTPQGTLFTIPCEAIFNNHPRVFRSALVGIGRPPNQRPVVCIELEPGDEGRDRTRLTSELLELARQSDHTREIERILFHPKFPVDIRHNAKIFREKLARWAARKVPKH